MPKAHRFVQVREEECEAPPRHQEKEAHEVEEQTKVHKQGTSVGSEAFQWTKALFKFSFSDPAQLYSNVK